MKWKILALLLAVPISLTPAYQTNKTEHDLTCLAKAVYHEARGESYQGKLAIAQVVLNRVKHPIFPKTICAVIYQAGQFSGISSLRVRDKVSWKIAKDIAYQALYGTHKPLKATYFHHISVTPNWKFKRVAKIGNHIFYEN